MACLQVPKSATANSTSSQQPSRPQAGSSSDWRPLDDLDRLVDEAWERLRGDPFCDRVFYTASSLGDWSLLWHLLAALFSVRGGRHKRNFFRTATALALESVLVNLIIKSFFRRVRPPDPSDDRPHNLRMPLTSSFPSGHACSAFLAATLLGEATKRRWPFWLLGTVVACSRIHVRIHHATDVAGGMILGIALGKLAKTLAPLGK